MFCRPIRGYEVRVRIAPATIACEYIGAAFFYRTILAVPMHVTLAPRSYRAPRGLVRLGGLQKEDHRSKTAATIIRSIFNLIGAWSFFGDRD